jgi:hypothetical protein
MDTRKQLDTLNAMIRAARAAGDKVREAKLVRQLQAVIEGDTWTGR